MSDRTLPTVIVLGTTQTLAWASSYYLAAVLGDVIARDTGVSTQWFFAAFSASLLISAFLGPQVGRRIDAVGGRGVLAISNVTFAIGLVLLALAKGPVLLGLAWLALGLGMSMGLYDAAFATLGRIYGTNARKPITGITLIAGFASTVGWPLTAWGMATLGWRETCLAWAAVHVVFGLPMNLFLLPRPRITATDGKTQDQPVPIDRTLVLLATAFALSWVVTAGMAAHFPRILEAAGASPAAAIAASALIGPAQVAARIFEASVLARFHPLVSARLATITHPLGALVVAFAGGGFIAGAFAILHGLGNGIITIARGTVPLALFGPQSYGYRLGIIGAPARILQAGAPLLFAFLIERYGAGVLVFSTALMLGALVALLLVRIPKPAA
ncbi:MAG: MFS transporter [Alphaproteobacteria bacterium]|nr:MFS transporter [Alphaproteobacteria bacterium]